MKYINMILIIIITIIFVISNKEEFNYDYVLDTSYINYIINIENEVEEEIEVNKTSLETFYGNVTAYTAYCEGCIGITASGYDVRNTIYYYDDSYGKVRIIAADYNIPFGTIIKISNMNNYDDVIAIVLDRGGAIGFDTNAQADLLFSEVDESYQFGRKKCVKFDILRKGF